MVSSPQVSQTTAIAKSTSSTDRLNALLPSVASEYSPVRVYIPGTNPDYGVNQIGGDKASSTGNVWIAPDVNGDGSAYTATIECLGAGGSGGGGEGRRSQAPVVYADTNTNAASTSHSVGVAGLGITVQGGTMVVAVSVPNNTAQTMTVTDSAGNNYTLLKSETATSGRSLFAFASTNIAQLTVASVITVTSTVSEVMCVMLAYLPDARALSSATDISISAPSVAANTGWPNLFLSSSYNKNDLVLTFAAANVAPPTTSSDDFTSLGVNATSTSTAQHLAGWWTQRGYAPGDPSGGTTLAPTSWNAGSNGAAATAVAEMHLAFTSSHVYAADLPGSGAGGGEYACEPSYPIVPGTAYSYFAGTDTTPAFGATDGNDGQLTVFDPNGKGLQGGVVANGGGAGKFAGSGGLPGTGSSNTIHYDGGAGGYSPAGVGSDFPPAYVPTVGMDLVLDDTGSPQDMGAWEFECSAHQAAGAYIGPATGGITAPPQVAPSGIANTSPGTAWEFAKGTSSTVAGGIQVRGSKNFIGNNTNWNSFGLSAWIRGHSTATAPNNWGADTSGEAVIFGTANICYPGGNVWPRGFSFFLDTASSSSGGILNFTYGESTTASSHYINLAASSNPISATDGNWHHVMFVNMKSTGIALYVDGVLAASSTAYVGNTGSNGWLATGQSDVTLGYLLVRGDRGYKGYMSSTWIGFGGIPHVVATETPSTTTAPAFIYGLSTTTGGAGGGSSAGSPGAGTAGSNGTGSTGGAPGSATGVPLAPYLIADAAGTPGNNAGTAGNQGIPSQNGGGGGGAGSAGSYSAPVYSLEIPVMKSATYNGMDSASSGAIYSTSDNEFEEAGTSAPTGVTTGTALCIAGGKSDDPSGGTMNTILQFPCLGNQLTEDGTPLYTSYNKWQTARLTLTLTINSTQASIMGFSVASPSGDLPDELTDTELAAWDSSASPTYDLYFYVPAGDQGRTVTFEFPWTLSSTSNPTDIIIGTLSGSALHDFGVGGFTTDEAEDWYCEFFGSGTDGGLQDATLNVEYFLRNNAANYPVVQSNGGGAGRIAITIPDPEGTPVTTILPTAATDSQGNQLAAGITTQSITTWQPGSAPLVAETWHYVGDPATGLSTSFASGWSNNASSQSMLGFRLMADGSIWIKGNIKAASGAASTVFTLPANYFTNATISDFSAAICNTANGVATMRVLPGGAVTVNAVSSGGTSVAGNTWTLDAHVRGPGT